MATTWRKTKAMNVLPARKLRSLVLRAHRQHRSHLAYEKLHSHNSSFDESLPTNYKRWRNPLSNKIPRGYLPVYVGPERARYIIPMSYLSMPDFGNLMEIAAEEFGFEQEGGLMIPCDEEDFEEILSKCLANHKTTSKTRKRNWE